MDNKFLRKYVVKKVEDGDYLHSSGYARAQSGSGIGAAAGAQNKRFGAGERQFVQGYHDSHIIGATKTTGERAKAYTPPKAEGATGAGLGAQKAGGNLGARGANGGGMGARPMPQRSSLPPNR